MKDVTEQVPASPIPTPCPWVRLPPQVEEQRAQARCSLGQWKADGDISGRCLRNQGQGVLGVGCKGACLVGATCIGAPCLGTVLEWCRSCSRAGLRVHEAEALGEALGLGNANSR